MARIPIRVIPVLILLLLLPIPSSQVEQDVKQALVQFIDKLSAGNPNFRWNSKSDPCIDNWDGIRCDTQKQYVKKIILDGRNLSGVLDASSLCVTKSLFVLSLQDNYITGSISEDISNCENLTHIYLSRNQLSGNLPNSLSQLSNLKRLYISSNNFSGRLPDLPRILGFLSLFAENNHFNGRIPEFNFSSLKEFNVANNNFTGPIPDVKGRFPISSFLGNSGLCGKPLPNTCPKSSPVYQVLIFSGYIVLGILLVLFIALTLVRRKNAKKEKKDNAKTKGVASDSDTNGNNAKTGIASGGMKSGESNRSEYSMTSLESGVVSASSSLVVLSDSMLRGLRFEDLLRAPAELIGRGANGSLYKVMFDNGVMFAVKRMRDWGISKDEFERRMLKIGQVKHPNVLPPVAYYCSKQEKLLVYEYQPNGSLFQLLHGSSESQSLDWGTRLGIAASISAALAFVHEELCEDGIPHGNLKSTNILFNNNMDPCISEYGLTMVVENQDQSTSFDVSNTKIDIYRFGVILLELLTGKVVQNNGLDLASWVNAVVREEWTVEVFDRNLFMEGASEERMVNLLQVAFKCVNSDQNERVSIKQVAAMINAIREEEERSIFVSSETLFSPVMIT